MKFYNFILFFFVYFLLTSKLYAYVGLAAFIPFLWQIIVAIIIVLLSIFILFFGVIQKITNKIKNKNKNKKKNKTI